MRELQAFECVKAGVDRKRFKK